MKRFFKPGIGIFTAILIVFILYTFRNQNAFSSGKNERIGEVRYDELVQRVTIAGNIVSNKKIIIKPPYSGYLKKVFVKIGDNVKKSDPIISVVQSLESKDPVFPLRAPFPGTVVQVKKSEGEYVSGNDLIARIDDMSQFYIIAKASEIDLVKIKKGQEAIVKVSAILDRVYKGFVREIALAAIEQNNWRENSTEFEVKIEIMDFGDKIRPGMSAIIDVTTLKKEKVLCIEHEFIEKRDAYYFVTLENGEEKKITIGIQNETVFEVISGLDEGARVKQVDFLRSDS